MQCIETCTLDINQNKEMLSKRLPEKLSLRFFVKPGYIFKVFLESSEKFQKVVLSMCTLAQHQTQLYSA